MSGVKEQVRAELVALTAPLWDHLKQIEGRIEEAEEELRDLREGRRQIAEILRKIDPDSAPKKNGKKKYGLGVGEERLATITLWLRERREELNAGEGFYASGLAEDETFPMRTGPESAKALRILHDHGIVRLDHVGTGGRKFYKVVT